MQVELRHQPSFSVARLHLAAGEQAQAESGAMAMHSFGVTVDAQMQGGLKGAFKRGVMGGESLFVTTFTGHPQVATWVDVAANLPGDIWVCDIVPGRALVVTRGSWLANAVGVTLDTKWGGAKMFGGGEGAFVLHATGEGPIVLAAYGAMDIHDLQEGQGFTVDSGHVVAYDDTISLQVRKASSGLMSSVKSGEGLVLDFQGPGRVVTQSRNPNGLITWLQSVLPGSRG
jgi:uncharacterized protein (TIGR00266 family)